MKKGTDNLNELLRRFVENSAADSMAEEIRQGDAMLDRYPAPALSPQASARLRSRLKAAYTRRHRRSLFLGWATVAAAAVAVVVFLFGGSEIAPPVQMDSKPVAQVVSAGSMPAPAASRNLPGYLANLWDDASRTESDQSFVALKTELDNIAAMIEAVSFKKNDASQDCLSTGEEVERMDTQINTTDFWQG